jgi:hypothetical protein
MLQSELPARSTAKVLATASRVVRWLESLLRPRLNLLPEQRIYRRIAGPVIMLLGFLLLLPPLIPLTNTVSALTVLPLAAGAMERDGLFFLASCATFTATLAYLGLLFLGGAHLLGDLQHTVLGS